MDALPNEIILSVVSELPKTSDISAWRLVNRRFADIAFKPLTRHIAILNTSACVGRLLATFKRPIPSRKITIYHVPWTELQKQTSGVHKLLWLDRTQISGKRVIPEEQTWVDTDIRRLLEATPQLRTITFDYPLGQKVVAGYGDVSSPLFWNGGFLPSPSMRTPYWHKDFTQTVSLTLSILNSFPSITEVEINGRFSAAAIPELHHTLELRIEALNRGGPADDSAIQSFLLAFAKLQRLRLCLSGPNRSMRCGCFTWRHLVQLELLGLHIFPEELVSLLRRHKELTRVTIANVRLKGGTAGWDEIFTAVEGMGGSCSCSLLGDMVHGTIYR